ncbi:MAG: DUF885 domain-containing protein [Thaumarchaeota archaeon]|nr:DUF885 domain-containing protein [Nitrososphaerota archaeon]
MPRTFRAIEEDFIELYGTIQCHGIAVGGSATRVGFHKYDDRIFVPSDRNLAHVWKEITRLTKDLKTLNYTKMSFRDGLRAREMVKRLASIKKDMEWNIQSPVYYLRAIGEGILTLQGCDHLPKQRRAVNMAKRFKYTHALFESSKKRVRRTSQLHVQVATQLGNALIGFFTTEIPRFVEDQKPQIRKTVVSEARAAAEEVRQYLRFIDSIKKELPERQPLGDEEYTEILQVKFGFDTDATAMREFGEREFEIWSAKLDGLARKLVPGAKSWVEVKQKLMDDHPVTDRQVITEYRAALAQNRKFLRKNNIVTLPEGETCKLIETPTWERVFKGFASCWNDGIVEGMRSSTLWMTPSFPGKDPEEHHREHYRAYQRIHVGHEGYPGHHVNYTNIAVHAPKSSRFITRFGGGIIEGWAVYAETVLKENGAFDEEQEFAWALNILWRCVRVINDVGLHTGSMSFDDAVKLLVDKLKMNPTAAESEVNRQLVEPGNLPKYLYGRNTIIEIREEAREKLGSKFDQKWFHDLLTQAGEISLPGLRELTMHEADVLLEKRA